MTRLIISTNHRQTLNNNISGWLYVLDLEKRNILQVTPGVEAPYRLHDTNPRGGMRGMRGLSFQNGEIALANYSSVLFFDRQWNLLRVFTHPSIAAIHEIIYEKDGVWVTSTANDTLAYFDMTGNLSEILSPRSQKALMKELHGTRAAAVLEHAMYAAGRDFRKRTYFNSDPYDRTHINSIERSPDGQLLLSLGLIVGDYFEFLIHIKTFLLKIKLWNLFLKINRMIRDSLVLQPVMLSELVVQPIKGRSAVVKINAAGEWNTCFVLNTAHNPSHSVRVLSDGTGAYLNTSHGTLIHFKLDGSLISNTKLSEKFLRGMLELPDGQLAIGNSNVLLMFDLKSCKITDQIELSTDILNTIFDIKILPPEFELPPNSLEEKIGRIKGYDKQWVIWNREI
jgi:hypothetical protein